MEKYRQKLEICQEDEDIPLNQTKPKKKKASNVIQIA